MSTIFLLLISNVFMTFAWYGQFSAAQLKGVQEILTPSVFCGFSVFYLKESIRWNHLLGFAFVICAGYLMFKK